MSESEPIRPAPNIDRDNAFHWEGAAEGELRILACRQCDALHHPPIPMCNQCLATDMHPRTMSGRATVYTFIKPVYPPLPMFDEGLIVALVDLEEGPRLLTNLRGIAFEDVTLGMPVIVDFEATQGGHWIPIFRPAD
ncbi:MAG: Zn-ribbon domain-containing OB-fold protein [Myxococcota bacterium]